MIFLIAPLLVKADFIKDLKDVTTDAANRRAAAASLSFDSASASVCQLHAKYQTEDSAFQQSKSADINSAVGKLLHSVSRYHASGGSFQPHNKVATETLLKSIKEHLCEQSALVTQRAGTVEKFVANPSFNDHFMRIFALDVAGLDNAKSCAKPREDGPAVVPATATVVENDRILLGQAQLNFLKSQHTHWTVQVTKETYGLIALATHTSTASRAFFQCPQNGLSTATTSRETQPIAEPSIDHLIGEELKEIFTKAASIQLLEYNQKRLGRLRLMKSELDSFEKHLEGSLLAYTWEDRDSRLAEAVDALIVLINDEDRLTKLARFLTTKQGLSLVDDRFHLEIAPKPNGDCKVDSTKLNYEEFKACFN